MDYGNMIIKQLTQLGDVTNSAEDFPIFDGIEWLPKGGDEKIHSPSTISRDLSLDTDQVITGIPFRPSAGFFFVAEISGSSIGSSWGFWSGTSPNRQSGVNFDNANSTLLRPFSGVVANCYSGSSINNVAKVNSIESAGITLGWTKTGSPTGTVHMRAIFFR